MICPSCGQELVEVDNPRRREVRHRRGAEMNCPAFRAAATGEANEEGGEG